MFSVTKKKIFSHHWQCIFEAHLILWIDIHIGPSGTWLVIQNCYHHWWNVLATTQLYSHPLFRLHKCSVSTDKYQLMHFFFQHGRTQWYTATLYSLSCQMPFSQIVVICNKEKNDRLFIEKFSYYCSASTSASNFHRLT